MDASRRDFLKKGGFGMLMLSMAGPLAAVQEGLAAKPAAASGAGNVLVVLQLSGGNDALNTVAPYGMGAYYDSRPGLAIPQKDVLRLDNKLGLHPFLKEIKKLYDRKQVAVINGVGYPNPNRSHFRSLEIWQTGVPERSDLETGWVGRYLDETQKRGENPLAALAIGWESKILLAKHINAPTIIDVNNFKLLMRERTSAQEQASRLEAFRSLYGAGDAGVLADVRSKGQAALDTADLVQGKLVSIRKSEGYPKSSRLTAQLSLIAQLIEANLGTRVFVAEMSNFDDHAREKELHGGLLRELDGTIGAFFADLEARKLGDRVTMVLFSEFGRRVRENASGGTDHGTAGTMLVIGNKVRGGLYGEMPSLTSLDIHGDQKYAVDFRSVYATLLERWLHAPSQDILGRRFEQLTFL